MSESTYIFFIDQDDDIKFDLIKRFNEIKQDYDIITVKRTQLIDKKYFEEKIYKINSSSLFTSYMLDKQFSTYITGIFINKSIYKKTNYYLKNINIDEIYVYEDMALYFL
ncbi:hypothetical protein J6P68_03045 [bacterium]|nr:hypothetical protein [bacterium]